MSTLTSFYDPGSDKVVPDCDLSHSWMKEFGFFDHDFKGKGMKFCCHHYPNPLPLLLRGILSLEDDISPTHFAGGGGLPRELLKIRIVWCI